MKPAPLALCANILHSQLKFFVCQTKACELDSKWGPKLGRSAVLIWAVVGPESGRCLEVTWNTVGVPM